MNAQSRLWLSWLSLGGSAVLIALVAFAVCFMSGPTPADFFGSPLKLRLWLALIIWNVLAWAARRVLVGKTKGLRLKGSPVAAFVLLKVSLLLAIGTLFILWLASAVAKWSLATVVIKAALLLLLCNLIFGLAGGAAINSVLAVRRFRLRASV